MKWESPRADLDRYSTAAKSAACFAFDGRLLVTRCAGERVARLDDHHRVKIVLGGEAEEECFVRNQVVENRRQEAGHARGRAHALRPKAGLREERPEALRLRGEEGKCAHRKDFCIGGRDLAGGATLQCITLSVRIMT